MLAPLLPERPVRRIGRPRVEERIASTAIRFVLGTGLRTFGWLHNYRRPRIRWEREASLHRVGATA